MFVCYTCGSSSPTLTKYRAHLYRHNGAAELKIPLACRQGTCKATFTTVFNLLRHVKVYHSDDEVAEVDRMTCSRDIVHEAITMDHEDDSNGEMDMDTNNIESYEDCMNDLRTEGVSLVAGLRANSSVPYYIIPKIVDSFNNMASSLVNSVKDIAKQSIIEAGADTCMAEHTMHLMASKLQSQLSPLEFLSSVYKQDKYFENHELFVGPQSIPFLARFEAHNGVDNLVYDTFQYVPVIQTIKSLLKNDAYVSALQNDSQIPNVYQEYEDGDHSLHHSLFGNKSKFSLKIQLFYDGLGTANPLRGQSAVNSVGVFYYTIANLPMKYNSCFANVNLLALCYSEDLKRHGFDPILSKFVEEINLLQRDGIDVQLSTLGMCTVYASLCQVTCDNLALNAMLGFIESFSCDYFCTICYATQDSIQTKFRAEDFEKRTISSYNADLMNLPAAQRSGKNHCRGVKHYCVLNNIEGYHVTGNHSLDIMHILLEGIVPVELGCILHALYKEKLVTVDIINRAVVTLWSKLTVNKCDKPPALNRLLEPGLGLSPSMKAVQYFALLKYLPQMIAGLIPEGNEHWNFLLHLSHLVDLLYSIKFTKGMITYLKDVISDHLTKFTELYTATWNVKLRPKHHFLVHLPDIIMQSGPLIGMSCMKYELKNAFFKRCAKTVCNFKNLSLTLAKRHQQRVLDSWLANEHIRDTITVQSLFSVPACSLAFYATICQTFNIESTDDVNVAKKINVSSVQYAIGNHVVIDVDPELELPIFGKIVMFVCSPNDEWYLVIELLHTDKFYCHYHGYAVSTIEPCVYSVIKHGELVDHHPLHCIALTIQNVSVRLIRLPYHVMKL